MEKQVKNWTYCSLPRNPKRNYTMIRSFSPMSKSWKVLMKCWKHGNVGCLRISPSPQLKWKILPSSHFYSPIPRETANLTKKSDERDLKNPRPCPKTPHNVSLKIIEELAWRWFLLFLPLKIWLDWQSNLSRIFTAKTKMQTTPHPTPDSHKVMMCTINHPHKNPYQILYFPSPKNHPRPNYPNVPSTHANQMSSKNISLVRALAKNNIYYFEHLFFIACLCCDQSVWVFRRRTEKTDERERKTYLFIPCLRVFKTWKKNKEREKYLAAGNRRACVCVEIDKPAARDSLTGGGGTKRDFFSVFVRERGRFGQRQKQTGE